MAGGASAQAGAGGGRGAAGDGGWGCEGRDSVRPEVGKDISATEAGVGVMVDANGEGGGLGNAAEDVSLSRPSPISASRPH